MTLASHHCLSVFSLILTCGAGLVNKALSLLTISLFPHQAALRQITDKAREFGAGPLFNQILPLLMSPTLEDQERHLLVKVIDRILYKLDDLVRPYVHKVGSETCVRDLMGFL